MTIARTPDARSVMLEGIAQARMWMRRHDVARAVAVLESTFERLAELGAPERPHVSVIPPLAPTRPVQGSWLDVAGRRSTSPDRRRFPQSNRASVLVIPPPV